MQSPLPRSVAPLSVAFDLGVGISLHPREFVADARPLDGRAVVLGQIPDLPNVEAAMSSHRSIRSALALACLATACATRVRSVLFDPAHPLPPKPADAAVVMFSIQRPECAYQEIGTVSAAGGKPEEITLRIRERAREMGGDAIVGIAQSLTDHSHTRTTLTGTVIKFREPSCMR